MDTNDHRSRKTLLVSKEDRKVSKWDLRGLGQERLRGLRTEVERSSQAFFLI
jgi:hypothetical protein